MKTKKVFLLAAVAAVVGSAWLASGNLRRGDDLFRENLEVLTDGEETSIDICYTMFGGPANPTHYGTYRLCDPSTTSWSIFECADESVFEPGLRGNCAKSSGDSSRGR